ncbi:hypothetical protein HZH66_008711 [Vespula vulgaris]|uniref:Uncharacterized protein n=1 Tax=Vespula vulgaris TaxID=7454 RepID=A0A834JQ15_VESVU|nr:hypothetical protein HZH66_008711 [Vespula vulgaris]
MNRRRFRGCPGACAKIVNTPRLRTATRLVVGPGWFVLHSSISTGSNSSSAVNACCHPPHHGIDARLLDENDDAQ